MVTGVLRVGEGKHTPSPEPHHSLMKINTSVLSKEGGCCMPRGKGKKRGGRRRRTTDVSLPSHSKLAKFSPSFAEKN